MLVMRFVYFLHKFHGKHHIFLRWNPSRGAWQLKGGSLSVQKTYLWKQIGKSWRNHQLSQRSKFSNWAPALNAFLGLRLQGKVVILLVLFQNRWRLKKNDFPLTMGRHKHQHFWTPNMMNHDEHLHWIKHNSQSIPPTYQQTTSSWVKRRRDIVDFETFQNCRSKNVRQCFWPPYTSKTGKHMSRKKRQLTHACRTTGNNMAPKKIEKW